MVLLFQKIKTNTQTIPKNINDEYDSYELLKRSALDLATFGGLLHGKFDGIFWVH